MKKNIYIVFLLITTMFSCAPIVRLGVPYKAKNAEIDKIKFNTDSTFVYNYTFGFKDIYSEGYWRKSNLKNKIVIESKNLNLNRLPITVKESVTDGKNPRIHFLFKENIIDSILYLRLIVNDTLNYDVGFAKSFYIPNTVKLRKFKILVDIKNMYHTPVNLRVATATYDVKSVNSNYFNVNLPITLNDFYYKKIKRDTIKVMKRKINWDGKMYYLER